jgi:glucose uptake protein GlcU
MWHWVMEWSGKQRLIIGAFLVVLLIVGSLRNKARKSRAAQARRAARHKDD